MVGCPLMCTFCPQDQLKANYKNHPDKYLSWENFKIVLGKLPQHVRIDFSGMAEPWANPDCTAMLRSALANGYNVALYTTLYGMTEPDAEAVVGLLRERAAQVETVCLHLPDAYANMRGWKASEEYQAVLDRFLAFQKENIIGDFRVMTMANNGRFHPALRLNPSEPWLGLTRAGTLNTKDIGAQAIEQTPRHTAPVSCSYTEWYDQNVLLPNGDVALCCMDYGLKHVIGNLLRDDYESLFTGAPLTELKRRNAQFGFDPQSLCKSCQRATCH